MNAVSDNHIAIEDILESLEEVLADEADILGPIRDTIPPAPWPSAARSPKAPWPSLHPETPTMPPPPVKAELPAPGPSRWPLAVCAMVAVVAAGAAVLTSPLVGKIAVKRAAVAIHGQMF